MFSLAFEVMMFISFPFIKGGEIEDAEGAMASKMLVFKLRHVNRQWSQVVGHFAVSRGSNSSQIASLIEEILRKVAEIGGRVRAVVCDGYEANKLALKKLGDGCSDPSWGRERTTFVHPGCPEDDPWLVYCFIDAPHLLKCERNHLLKVKEFRVRFIFFTSHLIVTFF